MTEIAAYINEVLSDMIPYEFGEWTQDISYLYFVGNLTESDYSYEDNHTSGTFVIDGWTRESKLSLIEAADKIKEKFSNLQTVKNGLLFFIRYGGADLVPSGEEGLHHITITLFTEEWKGE